VVERTLARLRLGDVPVVDYLDGTGLDPFLSPRPYLHPVRTLAGTVVTDALPADHRWHLGISMALQDVDGWNLWGGPTYVHGRGYVHRDDHGRIVHIGFDELGPEGFTEQLHWLSPAAELLLTEERRVRARVVARGWELEIVTALTNPTERPVRLGSPATNGRPGAGYGGLFWRLPPTRTPDVRTPAGTGEQATHGTPAPWIVWTDADAGFTLAITGVDDATRADPWFVRVGDYPGVGSQLAPRDPLVMPVGETATRGLRALVADGVLGVAVVERWSAEGADQGADQGT
jgi:hypothetical protein